MKDSLGRHRIGGQWRSGRTERERFEAKIRKSEHGCWLWSASTDGHGYGQLMVQREGVARPKLAHRLAYEAFIGPIPDGLCVLHQCDEPRCVRPDHLFLGTRADNIRDAVRKGRHPNGLNGLNGQRKLTVDDVREIRSLADQISQAAIAELFGVSGSTIFAVIRRRTWKSA